LLLGVRVTAKFEVPAEELQQVLTTALEDAEWKGITGPELTPFLLRQMAERSGGATLRANIALLENNARVAAAIASAIG
jgi:pseudouridine-5'-phosphate glycosidase